MLLVDFQPDIPTKEERQQRAIMAYDAMAPFLIENLPDAVSRLLPSHNSVALPPLEAYETIWDGGPSPALLDTIKPLFDGKPKFIKLSTRSPKETHDRTSGVETWCAEQAVDRLSASERCLDDCVIYGAHPSYRLRLFAFEMRPYSPQYEVRCFVKGNDLIALAQYGPDAHEVWQVDGFRQKARKRIKAFWSDTLHPSLGLNTYVFDICLSWPGHGLIEINPYGFSDPCALKNYDAVERFSGDIAFYPLESPR